MPAINLSDRGVEEKICMEFNGSLMGMVRVSLNCKSLISDSKNVLLDSQIKAFDS